eukprot:m.61267 g.61267  ORF g.61267 m.61267 type:complete len:2175 (+) comp7330_c0_seq1:95-6619(+)
MRASPVLAVLLLVVASSSAVTPVGVFCYFDEHSGCEEYLDCVKADFRTCLQIGRVHFIAHNPLNPVVDFYADAGCGFQLATNRMPSGSCYNMDGLQEMSLVSNVIAFANDSAYELCIHPKGDQCAESVACEPVELGSCWTNDFGSFRLEKSEEMLFTISYSTEGSCEQMVTLVVDAELGECSSAGRFFPDISVNVLEELVEPPQWLCRYASRANCKGAIAQDCISVAADTCIAYGESNSIFISRASQAAFHVDYFQGKTCSGEPERVSDLQVGTCTAESSIASSFLIAIEYPQPAAQEELWKLCAFNTGSNCVGGNQCGGFIPNNCFVFYDVAIRIVVAENRKDIVFEYFADQDCNVKLGSLPGVESECIKTPGFPSLLITQLDFTNSTDRGVTIADTYILMSPATEDVFALIIEFSEYLGDRFAIHTENIYFDDGSAIQWTLADSDGVFLDARHVSISVATSGMVGTIVLEHMLVNSGVLEMVVTPGFVESEAESYPKSALRRTVGLHKEAFLEKAVLDPTIGLKLYLTGTSERVVSNPSALVLATNFANMSLTGANITQESWGFLVSFCHENWHDWIVLRRKPWSQLRLLETESAFKFSAWYDADFRILEMAVSIEVDDDCTCDAEMPRSTNSHDYVEWANCRFHCFTVSDCTVQIECLDADHVWSRRLCSCVPKFLTDDEFFLDGFFTDKLCSGGHLIRTENIERFRWCDVVTSPLGLLNLGRFDTSIFRNIREIQGYLLVQNNQFLTSLACFRSLLEITPEVRLLEGGKFYTLIVTKNARLNSLGNLLQIVDVDEGVQIKNNPKLCIDSAIQYMNNDASFLSYDHEQCSQPCGLFLRDALCESFCAECDVPCQAQPIQQLVDLEYYTQSNCKTIAGSLIIRELPASMNPHVLTQALRNVTQIIGKLIVRENRWLCSLDFLPSLESVDSIEVVGNTNLVDARLLSLRQTASVFVEGNPHLCPDFHPSLTPFKSYPENCGRVDVTLAFEIFGNSQVAFNGSYAQAQLKPGLTLMGLTLARLHVLETSLLVVVRALDVTTESARRLNNFRETARNVFLWKWIKDFQIYAAQSLPSSKSRVLCPNLTARFGQDAIVLAWTDPLESDEALTTVWFGKLKPMSQSIDAFRGGNLEMALPANFVGQELVEWERLPVRTPTENKVIEIPQTMLSEDVVFIFQVVVQEGYYDYPSNIEALDTTADGLAITNFEAWSTDTVIRLFWQPPIDTSLVVAYEITVEGPNIARPWEFMIGKLELSISITCSPWAQDPTCILPFTTYRIAIRARSISGFPGSRSVILQATDESIPTTPAGYEVASFDSDFISLALIKPERSNGQITNFQVEYGVAPSGPLTNLLVPAEDDGSALVLLSGLEMNTQYRIRTNAATLRGWGPWSAFSTTRTAEQFPPRMDQPTATSASASLSDKMKLSWEIPSSFRGAVLRFEVGKEVVGGYDIIFSGNATEVMLWVRTGEQYAVRMVGNRGVGQWSQSLVISTDNVDASASESGSNSQNLVLIGVGVVLVVFIVVGFAAVYFMRHKNTHAHKRSRTSKQQEEETCEPSGACHVQMTEENQSMLQKVQRIPGKFAREIEFSHIRLLEKLGEGKFGFVHKAILDESDATGTPAYLVAVKSLKSEATEKERQEIFMEATVMAQFNHPNIIKVIGQITDNVDSHLMIVEQFCEHGCLNIFLQRHQQEIELGLLLSMSVDVADGMAYLSDLGFVHRDLAARNVLVSSDLTCKIADFGFARTLDDELYYASNPGQIPVRWTAPEALDRNKYSSASDCWSFGILLWEIFAFGDKPYSDWPNRRVWLEIQNDYRLPKPEACPHEVYAIMLMCWASLPEYRPAFAWLVTALAAELKKVENHSSRQSLCQSRLSTFAASVTTGKALYNSGDDVGSGSGSGGCIGGGNYYGREEGKALPPLPPRMPQPTPPARPSFRPLRPVVEEQDDDRGGVQVDDTAAAVPFEKPTDDYLRILSHEDTDEPQESSTDDPSPPQAYSDLNELRQIIRRASVAVEPRNGNSSPISPPPPGMSPAARQSGRLASYVDLLGANGGTIFSYDHAVAPAPIQRASHNPPAPRGPLPTIPTAKLSSVHDASLVSDFIGHIDDDGNDASPARHLSNFRRLSGTSSSSDHDNGSHSGVNDEEEDDDEDLPPPKPALPPMALAMASHSDSWSTTL